MRHAKCSSAQIVPTGGTAGGGYPAVGYSPYANRSFPTKLLWGETHLHTNLPLDAGVNYRQANFDLTLMIGAKDRH